MNQKKLILKIERYFDDIIRAINRDTYSNNTLLDQKLQKENNENILIYDISCKISICVKPLCIRFNKIDEFINIMIKLHI